MLSKLPCCCCCCCEVHQHVALVGVCNQSSRLSNTGRLVTGLQHAPAQQLCVHSQFDTTMHCGDISRFSYSAKWRRHYGRSPCHGDGEARYVLWMFLQLVFIPCTFSTSCKRLSRNFFHYDVSMPPTDFVPVFYCTRYLCFWPRRRWFFSTFSHIFRRKHAVVSRTQRDIANHLRSLSSVSGKMTKFGKKKYRDQRSIDWARSTKNRNFWPITRYNVENKAR